MNKSDLTRLSLDYYKQVIAVQMHFNELCIRTRWLAMTVLTAALGSSVYLVRTTDHLITIGSYNHHLHIPLSVLVLLAGAIAIGFIWRMDAGYYQKLLLASVHYAAQIENEDENLKYAVGNRAGLTQHLLNEVPEKNAKTTIGQIYWACLFVLFLSGLAIWAVSSSDIHEHPHEKNLLNQSTS